MNLSFSNVAKQFIFVFYFGFHKLMCFEVQRENVIVIKNLLAFQFLCCYAAPVLCIQLTAGIQNRGERPAITQYSTVFRVQKKISSAQPKTP